MFEVNDYIIFQQLLKALIVLYSSVWLLNTDVCQFLKTLLILFEKRTFTIQGHIVLPYEKTKVIQNNIINQRKKKKTATVQQGVKINQHSTSFSTFKDKKQG